MKKEDVTSIASAIASVVKPRMAALEARIAAIEGGASADNLLLARVKLLEAENAAMARRLQNRIPPQAPRRRA